jgi:signal transduction histidine kinase
MQLELEVFIRLVWLFTGVITVLMFFLCYLYLAMQKAREHESVSLAFSHLVIEGMETERRRVSRELHDIILPQVSGLAVSDQIRSICMELMPPDFARLYLKDSLADICDKFSKRTGIECVCLMDKDVNFSEVSLENQLHIYRMAQESFTNIEKHSQAKKTSLVVRKNSPSENILICIADDGAGLGDKPDGLGMQSMRQRADIIGAKIDFISESGNGLMVRIEIQQPPMRENEI